MIVDLLPPPPQADWAYFLDFDGTLVDIADRPDAIVVSDGLPSLLADFCRAADGALALVTGRSLQDLDRHLDLPHLPAAGVHGLEIRGGTQPKATVKESRNSALAAIRARAEQLASEHVELRVEDKGQAIAVHFRAAPDLGPDVHRALASIVAASGNALALLQGKMVVEVKPSTANKGAAVEAFLSQPPFAGRIPCFIGDDVTDEDGFRACNARGGISIHVGPPDAKTAARYRLSSPAAVHDWLEQLLDREKGPLHEHA
ncbi:trehalose-phosphatase [Nisaea acidiphila]|uniref:Trehalose 6-phosphate phosphatase n=1 Tax=Nisaea acidiphila TaxID=1862145 RepID=A0A9J7ASR5_9PROT|nr:trehalose-phosphatase [Nisaea acidiphila]UUX50715.1 trehalose-phosphatase [Nisaea acidiphila]